MRTVFHLDPEGLGGTEMFRVKKYGGRDAERRRREDRGAQGAERGEVWGGMCPTPHWGRSL